MVEQEKTKGTVVTGVIGEDVHIVGLRVLEYALGEAGFKVNTLGSQVSQEDFIKAAQESDADAILVSSLSGHAESLIPGFKQKCIEAGLSNTLIYLGGYLIVGEMPWDIVEKKFKDLGIDRIYPPGTSPAVAISDLESDIHQKLA